MIVLCGIYKIINVLNNKIYIGSSINVTSRIRNHFNDLKAKRHKNNYLQNVYNKYGKEIFTWSLIEKCKKERLLEREQYYLDSLKPEYNICKIAGKPESNRVLSKHQARLVFKMYNAGLSIKEICVKMKVGNGVINNILNKNFYSDFTEGLIKNNRVNDELEVLENPKTVLSVNDIKRIRWLLKYRSSIIIAKHFKISGAAIRNIRLTKSYTHIEGYLECPEILELLTIPKRNIKRIGVDRYTLDGAYIDSWESANDYCHLHNINKGRGYNITSVCRGRQETAYGYFWKYTNN